MRNKPRGVASICEPFQRGIKHLHNAIMGLRAVWSLGLSGSDNCLRYRLFGCGCVFALDSFLHWFLANILGQITERLASSHYANTLFCTKMAWLMLGIVTKNNLSSARLALWAPIARSSENDITIRATTKAMKMDLDAASVGGLVGDLGKAASPNQCIQIVLFTWAPAAINLLITVIDIWWSFGISYCFGIVAITSMCLYITLDNARLFVPYRRQEVKLKRNRASTM